MIHLMGMLPCEKEVVKVVLGMLIVLVWSRACSAENISAAFVFCDSLLEVGNNNYIISISKANYPPNGIDFGKPTGRFTNGRTVPDILGQELGLNNYTPPYLAPTTVGPVILKGVNYASGGAGILNETGNIFVGRINMDAQLDNFENTRRDIISIIGESATQNLFQRALFIINMGSNDFLDNYLTPILSEPKQELVSPEEFVGVLIPRYKGQLKRLYDMGARKMVVINVGPIGCIPYSRDIISSSGGIDECVALPNYLANLFNEQLRGLLQDLNNSLKESTFVYADVNSIFGDILQNFKSYGFENADSACCRVAGKHGGIVPCGPAPSKVCPDRSKYVFWDAYHLSENANIIIAKRLMNGGIEEIYPMNLQTLFSH